jgi:SAM-dependent methyltransferase
MRDLQNHATDYAERNRAAWNEVAPIHRAARKRDLAEAVQQPDFSTLDATERAILTRLDLGGKRVAQLCCNNGRELISVVKLGAEAGVGFDIADEFVQEAQQLAELAQVNCEFVRTNVYDIDASYNDQFDLVYITIGALCWFDDLSRFFAKVAQLLRPGGTLFIYESHPMLDMFALPGEDEFDPKNVLKLVNSYFRREPFVDDNGLDYLGNTQYDAKPTYSFPHTLAETVTNILQNGLTLVEFQEYSHDISADFEHLEQYQLLPLCYTLLARK